ncbi:MAG: hypothetical protein AABX83_04175 [Nanoarchaeota archaeon]
MRGFRFNKIGQMTIFVIVALIIVAGIVIYFFAKDRLGVIGISPELKPVFDYYQSCIEQESKNAISIIQTQGGRINVPEYLPGSEYAPSSSELNFLGFSVPYWYYVSGNGLIKEQIPSKADMERDIGDYIGSRVTDCDFSSFYAQGYSVQLDSATANARISDTRVDAELDSKLIVSKGDNTATKSSFVVSTNSKLGKFYNIARKIYEKEKKDAVFDKFGEDVLRLYAPVDGVEVSCSGKVWKTRDVTSDLKNGLEANIGAVKFKGNYYDLSNKKNKYYEVDLGENVDENINLIYSGAMPTKIEVNGEDVDNELMIASPVGTQEGLGILGFCYAPYHFVYDVNFPILVQIYNNEEMFQFPIVAIIDNNIARQAILSELEGEDESEVDLCEFMTQDVEINIYDSNLNDVDANVSYQCFNQKCRLGQSVNGKFMGKAPACFNGNVIVKNENFVEKNERFSTNSENKIDIIIDRLYNVNLDLKVGGKSLDGTAIVSFIDTNGESTSTVLPDVKNIKLSEGNYDIRVYVYGNSSIKIPASKRTQCQEVTRSGILGFFGSTKEQCFDISLPETTIEYALTGGGDGSVYLLEEQLSKGELKIDVDSLPRPKSLEELQYNYASFEEMGVNVQ